MTRQVYVAPGSGHTPPQGWAVGSRYPRSARAAGVALAGVLLCCGPGTLNAQSVRGWTSTSARFVQVSPLVLDSTGTGQSPSCSLDPASCITYATGPRQQALALTQDLSLIAWGLGVRGLSVTARLRSRLQVAGAFDWPRADDHIDAILAYAEYVRPGFRGRAGRQRTNSPLGFAGYDGLSVALSPARWLDMEAFGGRSLAQTLNQPANDAFRGLEDLLLDSDAWLFGGVLRASLGPASAVGVRYQRESYRDGSTLLSERSSVTVDAGDLPAGLRLHGRLDYDFGTGRLGKSEVRVSTSAVGPWTARLTYRHTVPYFDLSTIWGYFRPVAYDEFGLAVSRNVADGFGVWTEGGLRQYGDTETTTVLEPLRDTAWRLASGATWQASSEWTVTGRHRLEWGAGGVLNSGSLGARWAAGTAWDLGLTLSALQQFEEFRVGEGALIGLGAQAHRRVGERIELGGGGSIFRRTRSGTDAAFDSGQFRAWSEVRLAFGADPGRAR